MSEPPINALLSSILGMRAGGLVYWCPGCDHHHRINIPTTPSNVGDTWAWDGSADRPTFWPSVKVTRSNADEGLHYVCHHFVEQGHIRFLDDCTHGLKGQTVSMVTMPDWLARECET